MTFRAITYLPDELLYDIPETGDSALTLFQGFKASVPESSAVRKGTKYHHHKKGKGHETLSELHKLQRERDAVAKDLETVTLRKVGL
jgi:hypothetical protein